MCLVKPAITGIDEGEKEAYTIHLTDTKLDSSSLYQGQTLPLLHLGVIMDILRLKDHMSSVAFHL